MDSSADGSKALERDKALMIRHYMDLQDRADEINEEIYKTCCGIEALNIRIAEAKAAEERERLRMPRRAASGG